MGFDDLGNGNMERDLACKKCWVAGEHCISCSSYFPTNGEIDENLKTKLLEIIITAGTRPCITVQNKTIIIRRSVKSRVQDVYLHELCSEAWLSLTNEDLGDFTLEIDHYAIDMTADPNRPWSDQKCIEWFKQTYTKVVIHTYNSFF